MGKIKSVRSHCDRALSDAPKFMGTFYHHFGCPFPLPNPPTMKLFKIGDRLINLEAVTHASYDQIATVDEGLNRYLEQACTLSFFGTESVQIFYDEEAAEVWKILQDWVEEDLTPLPDPVEIK